MTQPSELDECFGCAAPHPGDNLTTVSLAHLKLPACANCSLNVGDLLFVWQPTIRQWERDRMPIPDQIRILRREYLTAVRLVGEASP